jgi:hypothetical protein
MQLVLFPRNLQDAHRKFAREDNTLRLELIIAAAVISIGIVVALLIIRRTRYPAMRHGEILPAGEMQRKYGLYVEQYRPPKLDPAQVPRQLRDLLPLATKWGIGDDIIRNDLQAKVAEREKRELQEALKGRTNAINNWLDSFGTGDMSREAAAFMYMLLGVDEMGLEIERDV